ncbi:two-component system sensor histidine kinase YesM [Halanaerobium saccharolyticum]|uniref:Two-component system sensor histidine kinase YesM n=1 Tax=Halanaerobium saccharolyticum TaxID=43595 RepID=A0A4R7YW69_9FIRM|nr:sensor histidine kinase [Halanaerobium saccharolyticum]RAK07197.1 two-component system sensor histidine kinase YesM [Halanaerobium saccharolyticum]TDW02110.1 two-component system sensor histidine kinase YesM [Halanaerobium saccharolyticum]TDX58841.1 two-component system sensor histidine kinase YesM [Halanaerobium saccharolyticum]
MKENLLIKIKIKLYRYLRKTHIQNRLIVLFLILSLFPMLITGIYSYQKSSQAIHDKINTYSVEVVNQVAKNIEEELTRMEYQTIEIAFSELVQNTLSNYEKLSEWEVYDARYRMRADMVRKFSFSEYISDVQLFTDQGDKIIAYGDTGFTLTFKDDFRENLLAEIRDKNGAPVWEAVDFSDELHQVSRVYPENTPEKSYGIIIGRTIKELYDGSELGSIVIRINEDLFSDVYRNIDLGQRTEIFIVNSEGTVVSTRNNNISFNEKYPEPELIQKIRANSDAENESFELTIGEERNLTAYAPIKDADWYIVSTIPFSYLTRETGQIARDIMGVSLIIFLLAVFLSYIFTKSISDPLNNLVEAMNQVEEGNLEVKIDDQAQDELAEASSNFNQMVEELKGLLEDVKEKEKQKSNLEFKALQAQINPHFLSNILNTARLLADMQNADNLENFLSSVINLLHLSMNNKEDLITVEKEVEYLKSYLNIQQFRLHNKFDVKFEIEADLMSYKIPRFLLQPVVENSIIHGISGKSGQGLIEIKGFTQNNQVIFTITDDGIGMSEAEIEDLLNKKRENKDQFSGIGINNVKERIELYFGKEYGIEIESLKGYFTTVKIILPEIN